MLFRSQKWKKEFNSDRRARTYDATIDLLSLRRDERLRVLQTLLPEKKDQNYNILELGAGTGIVTKLLATHYPEAKIVAIDGAQKMIDQAKSKIFFQVHDSRIRWVLADYSSPKWSEKIVTVFHLVVSFDSLHHLTHKRKKELYLEIFNAVTPGGVLLISDHVTSQEPFYEDPQFSLWIEEIQEGLTENSKMAWFKKKLFSWAPERVRGFFMSNLKERFTNGLLNEGENPMPLMDHVVSIRKGGFSDVIVEYRYSNFGIISARKREG